MEVMAAQPNYSSAAFKTALKLAFEAVKTWVLARLSSAVDGVKGGVAASYDTLEKLRAYVASEVTTINQAIGTKASQNDLDALSLVVGQKATQNDLDALSTSVGDSLSTLTGSVDANATAIGTKANQSALDSAVTTLNSTISTQNTDLTNAFQAADAATKSATKSELINGASTHQDFASVEAALAAMQANQNAIIQQGAAGGKVINITATVTMPSPPSSPGKQVYTFNDAGTESGVITSSTLSGYPQVAAVMNGNELTVTGGDMLLITYDEEGNISDAQFHNDKTKAIAQAAVTARIEAFDTVQTAGNVPDSLSLRTHLEVNYVQASDLEEAKDFIISDIMTLFPNS